MSSSDHDEYRSHVLGQLHWFKTNLWPDLPHCSFSRSRIARRRCLHPLPGLQELNLHGSAYAVERCYSFRQEHHLPQAGRLVYRLLLVGPHYRPLEQPCQVFGGQREKRLRRGGRTSQVRSAISEVDQGYQFVRWLGG